MNRPWLITHLSVLHGIVCALPGPARAEERVMEVIAVTHATPAPGTTKPFTNLGIPVMSSDGTVAYLGSVDIPALFIDDGIWVHAAKGSGSVVALAGTDSPWPFSEHKPDLFALYQSASFFHLLSGNRIVFQGPRGLAFSNFQGGGLTEDKPFVFGDLRVGQDLADVTFINEILLSRSEWKFTRDSGVVQTLKLVGAKLRGDTSSLLRNDGDFSVIECFGACEIRLRKFYQFGDLICREGSRTIIDHTSVFSGNHLAEGLWQIENDAILTLKGGEAIKRVGRVANVFLRGSAQFNNLPGSALNAFKVEGGLILEKGADLNVAGSMSVEPGGRVHLKDRN